MEFYEELDEVEEKPFDRQQMKRMLGYVRPYKKRMWLAGASILIGALATMIEPYLIGLIVDVGVLENDWGRVQQLAALLAGLHLLSWFGRRGGVWLTNLIGQDVLYDLRQEIFAHIETLGLRFFDSRPVGRILSRITGDVNAIGKLVQNGLVTLAGEGFILIGIFVVMIWMSPLLTLVAFITFPALLYIVHKMRTTMETGWRNLRRTVSNISAHTNESVNGILVIQAYGRERHNISEFEQLTQDSHDVFMSAARLEERIWPSLEFTGVVGTALVVSFGAWMVLEGELTIGFIAAFVAYQSRFFAPLSTLSRIYTMILKAMASAERIFEFLDHEPEIQSQAGAAVLPPVAGRVRFDHVDFRYGAEQPLVLQGIDFTVAPGETVALVGHTGSGKTTIANLVMRFYDPAAGAIRIDGYDLREMELASVRQQAAMVLQDGFAFSGSIAENIRYGRLEATDDEIMDVCEAVGLAAFVRSVPAGLAYDVGERGNRLSVGQRQLLAFARALIADPRILILDEATSSVDTETELVIQAAMERLLAGRTAFIIAHRLSTIQDADLILVLDHGQIVERGSHEELLALQGWYYELYATQFR